MDGLPNIHGVFHDRTCYVQLPDVKAVPIFTGQNQFIDDLPTKNMACSKNSAWRYVQLQEIFQIPHVH